MRELTERQREALRLISLGYRNQEIAAALGLTFKSAKNLITRVLRNTESRNRTEAARKLDMQPQPVINPPPRLRQRTVRSLLAIGTQYTDADGKTWQLIEPGLWESDARLKDTDTRG